MMGATTEKIIEHRTGRLFGDFWHRYDDELFKQSVTIFQKRWFENGEPEDFFHGKRCLDAGCGGGRYSFAMALMGAASVVGVDVSEDGIEDARRRGSALGLPHVTFRRASVLELPFSYEEFDFVCCSGVLHHTSSIESGLAELYRVLKPGGSLYLLLYGAGGLYWPLNLVLRSFAAVLGQAEVERCIEAAGLPANKHRTILDDLFVPLLETYSAERVESLLRRAGFRYWRRWGGGQMDHESDPATLVEELEIREHLWQAGASTATDLVTARIEMHLANLCRSVVLAAQDLIEQQQAGRLSIKELHDAIIGSGHHRIIAERP